MWHQLPSTQKRRPGGYGAASPAADAGAASASRFPAGRATLGRTSGRDPPSAGTTSSRRTWSTCPRSRSTSTTSRTRSSWSSSRPAATGSRSCGRPRTWRGSQQAGHRASAASGRRDGALALARHVRRDAAAAGLAGLRQPGRSGGLRALDGRAAADRGRVPSRGVRHADGTRAPVPVGRRARRTRRAATSTSRRWDPVAVGTHPAGASAWGVHDLVGNGWEWTSTLFAPFPGFQPDGVVPRVLGRLLRRRARRDEGRLAGDGAPRWCAASFRNWFRPTYPYVYATFRCVRPAE